MGSISCRADQYLWARRSYSTGQVTGLSAFGAPMCTADFTFAVAAKYWRSHFGGRSCSVSYFSSASLALIGVASS